MRKLTRQKISVVVPIYNELENLKQFHRLLIKSLQSLHRDYEIIYVDDHSTDGSYAYLAEVAKKSVRVLKKEGAQGKAFSLMQGFAASTGNILVMIDGDLQYSPSVIPFMFHELDRADVVVANRSYQGSHFRKLASNGFRFVFGKLFFGFAVDVQSGLKVFKREVYETVSFTPSSGWAFDLEFLHRARSSGFRISSYDIVFSPRIGGRSKVGVLQTAFELATNALRVKLRRIPPLMIPPDDPFSMRGAGIGHKKQKFVSHTTLPFHMSAFHTFTRLQKYLGILLIALFVLGIFLFPIVTLRFFVAALSILYFIDTVFHFILVERSVRDSGEITFTDKELSLLEDNSLPVYSILCPLYKEAHVIPQFLEAIAMLEWPREKLDVMLLLEEDDVATIAAVERMGLPYFVRTVIVPHSMPKTKPKACNYGLSFAKGEYLVIYDAEDMPDPLQLKKAYIGFQKSPANIRCLQAKLNYYNPHQNLLTRFFTAEYSLWFDVMLPGLQSFRSALPLGGTSNHFRTQDLRDLQGWDPFNVTEDADLGVRLFQAGYQTAIIDSTTLEEANSKLGNWIRQRSRWVKGYMQTYLVHMRDVSSFVKNKGIKHNLIFQMTVGGKLLFILINPLMWSITFLYFAFYYSVGSFIHSLYIFPISYLAVFSWIFGNFLFLYYYMIGCAKKDQWALVKYVYLIPFYWFFMSYAAGIAFYQLLFKPHYWEKTVHGLHLQKKPIDIPVGQPVLPVPVIVPAKSALVLSNEIPSSSWLRSSKKETVSGKSLFWYIEKYTSVDSFLTVLVLLSFLSFDILLVVSRFSGGDLSTYLMISILGKAIFILSQMFGMLTSLFFHLHSKKKSLKQYFNNLVFYTFIFGWSAFVLFGLEGQDVLPAILGRSVFFSSVDLGFYMFSVMCSALVSVFVLYGLTNRVYIYAVIAFLMNLLQGVAIYSTDHSMSEVIRLFTYASASELLLMILLKMNSHYINVVENNLRGIFRLFYRSNHKKDPTGKSLRILIFNWRDTKHSFAGGAEVYIHELAKRWVKDGNSVTVFCGNDNHSPLSEAIDGVEVKRRGGTYTVYLFAFFYYMFKFRNNVDVVIDCENGIPFFTPLYVRKPIFLVIHHVHQDVFRKYLLYPIAVFAALMESKVMPIVYRNIPVITVSRSSRHEISKLGFSKPEMINIIYNGVEQSSYTRTCQRVGKTPYPSFLYLGRLKAHKNIDVALSAFAKILPEHPEAKFFVVGDGEVVDLLKNLTVRLGIVQNVEFLGKIPEDEKQKLLAMSWVALQPSQVEGWGITVIEANAAGTPVIASRVSGLQDSVVDMKTGLLVTSRDVAEFAKAMNRLISDKDFLQILSTNARLWSKNFDWDESAKVFYSLIRGGLGDKEANLAYGEVNFAEVREKNI